MQPSRTFVMRCWREGPGSPDGEPAWRFAMEEVGHDRRRHGFGSFQALVAFWRRELQGEGDRDKDHPEETPNPG